VATVKTLLAGVVRPRTDLEREEGAILNGLHAGHSLSATDI
jgi:hypothetical protein